MSDTPVERAAEEPFTRCRRNQFDLAKRRNEREKVVVVIFAVRLFSFLLILLFVHEPILELKPQW